MVTQDQDPLVLTPDVNETLPGLFRARLKLTPDKVAYRYFDSKSKIWEKSTWSEMAHQVSRFQQALLKEKLKAGDTVAIMLPNCREWIMMEQAALGLGLIVIPLFANDRAENVAYILQDAVVKLLIVDGQEHLKRLAEIKSQIDGLVRLVSLKTLNECREFARGMWLEEWLPDEAGKLSELDLDANALATIVYTSGTTGRPKGVMLSHRNILSNAIGGVDCIAIDSHDLFLSFLPLSHMLERSLGYYIPMLTGATVAFARSVPQLAEDLVQIKPTVLISVPRIYERVYGKITDQLEQKSGFAKGLFNKAVQVGWAQFELSQGRANWSVSLLLWPLLKRLVADKVMQKLGGRLKVAICGGAAMSQDVGKMFIGLGLNLVQGYGLTETSPILCGNRIRSNDPASVGSVLKGVELKIADNGELLAKGDGVMLGYWNNPTATKEVIDDQGWFHTGDIARIENNHVYITGRVKEIIVLSNGEKVPPSDIEMAIALDPLFEQAVLIGEGRPFLTTIAVLNAEKWKQFAKEMQVSVDEASLKNKEVINKLIKRVAAQLGDFPGYAKIPRMAVVLEPWTIDNGLITPTLKLRRQRIVDHFKDTIDQLYKGH